MIAILVVSGICLAACGIWLGLCVRAVSQYWEHWDR